MSSRRSARAPPAVAAQTASAGVIPISRTASATQNGIDEVYDEPGLQSVASATVDPGVEQPAGVRVRRPGGELGTGQQGAPTVVGASGQCVDVGVGQVRAVVGAGRAQLHRELHARARAELVGVHPHAAARRPARGQDRAGVVGVEGAPLAEHVDPPGVRCGGVQHRPADQADVVVRAVGVLGGHHVRAEEGGLVARLGGDPQRAGLVGDGQPVPALDLDGGGALPQRLPAQPARGGPQFVVAGGPGGADRGPDAAAGVRLTGHPGGELGGPVPGEDQVRVAVHEAGQHGGATGVDPPVGGRRVRGRPDPDDPARLDQHRRVAADAQRPARRPARW